MVNVVGLKRQGTGQHFLGHWFCYSFEFLVQGQGWLVIATGELRGASQHYFNPRHYSVQVGGKGFYVSSHQVKGQVWFHQTFTGDFDEVCQQLEAHFGNRFTIDQDAVEAYTFYRATTLQHFPWLSKDYYLSCTYYEACTDTIRHSRTNRCLVWFVGTEAKIYEIPPNEPLMTLLGECVGYYQLPHQQRGSAIENKGWLTWRISEYLKGLEHQHPTRMEDVIRA